MPLRHLPLKSRWLKPCIVRACRGWISHFSDELMQHFNIHSVGRSDANWCAPCWRGFETNNCRICQPRSLQLAEVRSHSRVSIKGEIVVQFDYSGMVQLLVYPVLSACVPGRKRTISAVCGYRHIMCWHFQLCVCVMGEWGMRPTYGSSLFSPPSSSCWAGGF